MRIPTLEWIGEIPGRLRLIDQTLLPGEYRQIECERVEEVWEAIKKLRVRGAPAIGCAGAFGVVIGVQNLTDERGRFFEALEETTAYLATSRPTAVNLFWALERMRKLAHALHSAPVEEVKRALLKEARSILEEDYELCRRIGENGAKLLPNKCTVITHCNAGALATSGYGTALGVIYSAHEQGKQIKVFADETRPLLQGARLTCWELREAGIETTLICDNMAGTVLRQGLVDCAIVGADRIARNGDTANKIGTYGLAVLAKEHNVPFYVAAPYSTLDLSIASGEEIPIEERDRAEIAKCRWCGKALAPGGIIIYNPAFDVTPAEYITGIITERGVIHKPTEEKIRALHGEA